MARILVIEDNPDNLELMSFLLDAFGHSVVTATDGAEGLTAVARELPDLIVSDVHLPKVDGYEIARQLKADPAFKDVPLVAVTALAMVGDRDRMLESGFDGYITKPIDPEKFVADVEAFLRPEQRAARRDTTSTVPAPATEPTPQRATVLVVDDRSINREFLRTLLGYVGYGVLEAADGVEALERVRTHRPALVITDVLMPTMDGVEFANRLHADPAIAQTPIIFYTATYRLAEAGDLARSCGVSRVLPKPSEPQDILDAVAAELGHSPAPAPAIPRTSSPPETMPRELPVYLRELSELQARLQKALATGMELIGDQGPITEVSERLAVSYGTVQTLSLRVAALLELGLVLPSERDPERLPRMFCRAARDIMNARYAIVATGLDGEGPPCLVFRGLSAQEEQAVRAELDPRAGLFAQVLADGKPRRLADLGSGSQPAGLPRSHPAVRNLLVVPLVSGSRRGGWLCFANKLASDAFSEDDEQFAVALASQFAPNHDNLTLYRSVKQYAEQLEKEIGERKRAAAELQASETKFRQLAENIRQVFFLLEPHDARVLYLSPAFEEVWGRSREEVMEDPEAWLNYILPDDRPQVIEGIREMTTTGRFTLEYRIVRPDGAVRWVEARGFPITDDKGELVRVAGLSEDITEQKAQLAKIARLTRIYAVMSGINSAIVRTHDREELLQDACRIAVSVGEFSMAWAGVVDPGEREGRVVAWYGGESAYVDKISFSTADDAPASQRPASRALRERRPVICNDIRNEHSLGELRPVLLARGQHALAAFPLIVDQRAVAVLVLFAAEPGFFDEEELRLLNELQGDLSFALQYIAKEEQLAYLAYFDPLTGLPNSTLFHDRLDQLVRRGVGSGSVAAVVLLDLDHFTQVNDTLGRHIGDALLKQVARRLAGTMRAPNLLGRIGADTFAVVVADLHQGTDAAGVVQERIMEVLSAPFAIDGEEIRLSAHAGVSLYPADGEDADILFRNAEVALKQARASSARFLYYSTELNARAAEKLKLENALREAVEAEQFVLHYQPKLDARTGRIAGLEALIRWNSPGAGLVPPNQFIGALEDLGMIVDVGRWALCKALSDYQRWREAGLTPPRVAVNVSSMQLQRPDFVEMVHRTIESSGTGAEGLELEITESLIMEDIEANTRALREIREMGVAIAIDDFGTGYSSLRYLATLPVHSLKIDRSFIETMAQDADSMAIVSTVISLAHALDLTVVAEGVDSEEQARFLRLMRCDEMQGYLFSVPVPAEACAGLLATQH